MAFKAVIFDMDGTLTVPVLDFDAMRAELGIAQGDLATVIGAWPRERRAAAWAVIERHEHEARLAMEIQPGAVELVQGLDRAGVRLGILTRNLVESVAHLCDTFGLRFDRVIDRTYGVMKPDPRPVLDMLAAWQVAPTDALVVGDYVHDIECGRRAGAWTCFVHNAGTPDFGAGADFTVTSLAQVADIVQRPRGAPRGGPAGA